MLEKRLIEWAEINSGSHNIAGLAKMAAILEKELFLLCGNCEVHTVPDRIEYGLDGTSTRFPVGKALTAHLFPEEKRRVLLCGHYDTVFDKDHPFQRCRELPNGILNGPGVADMKGGLLVLLEATKAFSKNGKKLGIDILFVPDEEIGSMSSVELFTTYAKRCLCGFLVEPSPVPGDFVKIRGGSAVYIAHAKGKAAHVGRNFSEGRSATYAIALFSTAIHELNRIEGLTANIGQVQGGTASNCVADSCGVCYNFRFTHTALIEDAKKHVEKARLEAEQKSGCAISIYENSFRGPKPSTPAQEALFKRLESACQRLGIPFKTRATGGVCDGNNLLDCGLANIDTLGVIGDKLHSDEEFCLIDSIHQRISLLHTLLRDLAET